MAKVKGGVLGDVSGSVGNVTFARARGGIRTVRVRSAPSNPRSQAQQQQRGRFKQIQQFASVFLAAGLVRPFWRSYARGGLSAFNAFVRANSAAMPDGLNPAAATISQGNGLAGIDLSAVAPSAGDPNTYVLTVDSPSGGKDDDLLVGMIYNGQTGKATMVDAGATRVDGQVEVALPASWVANDEDALFAYAFAYRVRKNGRLRLCDSSALKVNANAFAVPAPDVPPAEEEEQDVPFGQLAG